MHSELFYYLFAVPSREPERRRVKEFQMRDGLALRNLEEAVRVAQSSSDHAWSYRDEIRNVPGAGWPTALQSPCSDHQILFAATRPPLSDPALDHPDGPRKRIARTDEPLEKALLARLRRYFAHCDRERVSLSVEMAQKLSEGYSNRAEVNFSSLDDARITRLCEYGPGGIQENDLPQKTLGYLINLPATEQAPRIVWAFGMSGKQTLLWNKCLAMRFSHLLTDRTFVVAEFDASVGLGGGDFGPAQLEDAVRDLSVEIILEV